MIVPPSRVMVPIPAVVVAVAVPPQVLLTFAVFATANPEGRLSVKAKPWSAFAVLELVMVNVNVAVTGLNVNTGIWVTLNALVIDGGSRTEMVAATLAWSTVALIVSTPAEVAVKVSVAIPFAWTLVCTLERSPCTALAGKMVDDAGKPISTRISVGDIVPPWLSCRKLAVTVEVSPTLIGLGPAVLVRTM